MDNQGSRYSHPKQDKRERLEDQYRDIGIPALAAAVTLRRNEKTQRQTDSELALTRLQQMAQS